MEAPFAYGRCTYSESSGILDTNTNGIPGITVTRSYHNYYGRSVYVKDRNGLSIECVTQAERDDDYKFLVRDTYQISHEGYSALRQFVEASRADMANKSQRFQAFMTAAMAAIYRIHEANKTFAAATFYVDGWVNVDQALEKPLYVSDLDLLVHSNQNWQHMPHPLSTDQMILQQYGNLIESQDYVGVTYEIVDTQQAIKKRFINLNGQILNPKVSRSSNKADGIYIYLHRRIDGAISIEEKYYPFTTAPTITGVFNTREEAIAFGDVKTKRAVELLALESELTEKKTELERVKHDVAIQENQAKQERTRLETELAKMKAEHGKSQSERDNESREREHKLSIEINKKNSELAILKSDLEREKVNRDSEVDRKKNEYDSMKAEYDRLKLALEKENMTLKAEVEKTNAKIKEEVEKESLRRQKEKNDLDKEFAEYKVNADKEKIQREKELSELKALHEKLKSERDNESREREHKLSIEINKKNSELAILKSDLEREKVNADKEKIQREKELSELKALHEKLKSERDDKSHEVKTETDIKQTKRKEKNSEKSDKRSAWIEGLKFGTALVGAAVTGFLLFSKITAMFPAKELASAALETAIGKGAISTGAGIISSIASKGKKLLKGVGKSISSLKFW